MNTAQLPPLVLAIAATFSMSAYTQDKPVTEQAATPTAQAAEMTDGEIRKVDKDTKDRKSTRLNSSHRP